MAVGSPPTVRRRQLGRELRRLREESGLLAEQLAERLRCSASRISRIETARIRIAPGTVHEILDVLGVDGSERSRLVDLARQAEEPRWWQPFAETLRYEYSAYIALESEARSVKVFEPILVYGLLQTEEYARAVLRHGPPGEMKAQVAARLARQKVLDGPGALTLHAVLDEAVLHHVIGTEEVLRGQLRHLVAMARRPNVTVQVLPFGAADALKSLTGPAVILDFVDPNDGPVVYLENLIGDLYVQKAEEVQQYLSIFDRLCRVALSPRRSVEVMRKMSQ